MPRNFRQISTGRYLARFDDLQTMTPAGHLAHVAAEYGTPAADLELIETAVDLRDPVLMISPPPPDPATLPDPQEQDFTPQERKRIRTALQI